MTAAHLDRSNQQKVGRSRVAHRSLFLSQKPHLLHAVGGPRSPPAIVARPKFVLTSSDVKQREDVLAWPRMKAGSVYQPAFRTASAVVVVFHRQIFGVFPAPKRSGPDGNVLCRRNAYNPTNADLPSQGEALASSALSQDGRSPVWQGGECGACRASRPLSFPISAPLTALFTSHDQRMGTLQRGPGVAMEVPSVGWSNPLGAELFFQRELRRMLVAATIIGPLALAPEMSAAEGLLDFFFGGSQKQQPQTPFFANIFNTNLQPPPARPAIENPVVATSGPSFCVRSCDGRYFPLMRGAGSPTQMCQAFCPASPTEVFFGSSIDNANAASGERYTDSENAFAYRKALRADCTCNGHNPAGLAAFDLALDDTLRPGDVLATQDGLVAYSGIGAGNDQNPGFTPVASFPGLTPQVRARLNDMKVAPARADTAANNAATSEVTRTPLPATSVAPKSVRARDKRVDAD